MHSFHIYRYDPDADEKPRMQVIEVEVGHADRMLLDVLTRLKAIDPSLSFGAPAAKESAVRTP